MELRHLRYFIAMAEEEHFGRAANRLHVQKSPLSRAIIQLETELGVRLFDRDTRKTRITRPGVLFLEDARRVMAILDQARKRVRAAAHGASGILRIGYSDGLAQSLSELVAQFRQDELDVVVRITEMSFAEQAKSLRAGLLDVGLAMTDYVDDEIVTEPLWHDPVVVVLPAKHDFARRKSIPLSALVTEPLILCDPDCGSGGHSQLEDLLRAAIREPNIAEYAVSAVAAMTLVASGYGVALMGAKEVAMFQRADVAIRPVADQSVVLTTFLMRSRVEPLGAVQRFIECLKH